MRSGLSCVAGTIIAIGCAAAQAQTPPVQQKKEEPVFQGIRVELLESAHDGEFRLGESDRKQKVDPGSTLTLRFHAPSVDARLGADKRWVGLNAALAQLADLQREYADLLGQAKTLGAEVNQKFRDAATNYNGRLIELLKKLVDPASGPVLSRAQMNSIMNEAGKNDGDPWDALVKDLTEQRTRMYDGAKKATTPRYFAVVRAYRLPKGAGEAQQVHVEGYDTLPTRPIGAAHLERGLPSARELAEIQAQLAGAELVADAVREIQANKQEIRSRLRDLMDDIGETLQAQLDRYRQLARRLEGKDADQLVAELRKLNVTEANRLAARIATLRRQTGQLTQALAPALKTVEPLRTGSSGASLTDIVSLFQALDLLKKDLPEISRQLEALGKTVAGLPEDLRKVVAQVEQKASAQAKADLRKLLDDITGLASGAGEDLFAGLPKTKAAVDALAAQLDAMSNSRQAVAAIDGIQPAGGEIPKPLDKLDDGVLDLRRTDAGSGDAVEVRIAFVGATADGQPDLKRTPEKQVNYSADVLNTGWHRRFSGDLIFVKALKGEGSDVFKPNVAVSMEWHYYDRQRGDGWWNRLDPGFGVHAANLDQSAEQNVELGAGINMSIFGGLLRVAYGWNMSVRTDRPYLWIGFGLFGSLNNLQVVQGPPGKPSPAK